MPASKSSEKTVTYYPVEGVWKDQDGKVLPEGEPQARVTPVTDQTPPPAPPPPAGSGS